MTSTTALSDASVSLLQRLLDPTPGTETISRAGFGTLAALAVELLRRGRNVVLVVRQREELLAVRGLIQLLTPELSAGSGGLVRNSFGDWTSLGPCTVRSTDRLGWADRMATLHALRHGRRDEAADGAPRLIPVRGVVLTADNLLLRLPPLSLFDGRELRLTKGEELPPELILEQAIAWGYERVPMVSNPGEVARRGDILDILPPGFAKPLRLDFFGDLLEEIREFDPATQRSLRSLPEATLLPVSPLFRTAADAKAMRAHWDTLFQRGLISENERSGMCHLLEQGSPRLLPGAAFDGATLLEDWLPADPVWLLPGRQDFDDALASADLQWREALREAEFRDLPARLCLRAPDALDALRARSLMVHAEPLRLGIEATGTDLPERDIASFTTLFPSPSEQDRPWQTFVQAVKTWQTQKKQILLSFASLRSRDKFLKLASQDGLAPSLRLAPGVPGLYALQSPFRGGADLTWNETLILGEDVIQPHAPQRRKMPSGAFKGLEHYEDLAPGELLVHRDYGIARFGGLLRMSPGGVPNDYLLLTYAGDDRLYVPVDRLSLIQRYKGGSELTPPLDRLGGGAWQAGKEKARKAIEQIAADLVDMYAWRKVAKGFRYGPVGDLYREFEATFGFEETPDQARAIQDMLADMERPEPMDRLICGDVGFGKTEVALRAAFRAASEGRQVALLCPTTVLAEQHYQTFRARLSGFAVNVGLLSRFVPPKKQKEVLKAAAAGQIDVLIGTHRLLSNDVSLPNLGLLILDEEQRFGVRHKEKLKQLKKSVDALTLTATPIPRTLQLSISGVRELSVIETAPPERKPVATALIERDNDALRQILRRELDRKGQIFWVHNRVQGLAQVTAGVRELVPDARVGMAHGQMPERELEDTMHRFWHGELDVLVCTAIVESGLDFPRANTLIVDQAHMFGLGQLYQLRGRVGRSDRQAYAVFVVSDLEHLPKTAKERLRIILDMDYLGAGFQVAMEDLRLRGAGNILGEVQSGHMGRVGIDLYLEMLEEAVARLKGEGTALVAETEINLGITAHIPETYITDGHERLRWYRRLSAAPDSSARHELAMELLDRFGRLPEELETFLSMLELKAFLCQTQALRADIFADRVRISWSEKQTAFPLERLLAFMSNHKKEARLSPPAVLEYRLDTTPPVHARLDAARHALEMLLDTAR